MAGKVLNIKVCSPLKLRSGLTGNYHAICHYSYNLPSPPSKTKIPAMCGRDFSGWAVRELSGIQIVVITVNKELVNEFC